MSKCHFCSYFRQLWCDRCADVYDHMRRETKRFEWDESGEWDLWDANSAAYSDRLKEAFALLESDGPKAISIYKELAEAGSVWAVQRLGLCFEYGQGVDRDTDAAQQYYYQASVAGSWYAMLSYARVLQTNGHHETAIEVLRQGIEAGYVSPAYRLARLLYDRERNRRSAREVAPLLENAVAAGHPLAKVMLSQLLVRGKLGFRGIARGFRLALEGVRQSKEALRRQKPKLDDNDATSGMAEAALPTKLAA